MLTLSSLSFPTVSKNTTVAIITADFNYEYTKRLEKEAIDGLKKCGLQTENIECFSVPGSFELLFATQKKLKEKKYDAIISLGVVIRGETFHFELVAESVSRGIAEINITSDVPVIFGVLACDTEKQVEERIRLGQDFARAAVEMMKFGD